MVAFCHKVDVAIRLGPLTSQIDVDASVVLLIFLSECS